MGEVPENITHIVQPDRFWWNVIEAKALFAEPDINYSYHPYTLVFQEPNLPKMIKVRSFIYLDIILGNSQLLDAGVVTDYDVHVDSIGNIIDELLRIGEDAHLRFLQIFKERNSPPYISPTFQPILDLEVLDQKIRQLVETGASY